MRDGHASQIRLDTISTEGSSMLIFLPFTQRRDWPPFSEGWICRGAQEERFQLPAEVRERLEAYAARFFVLKTPRKLLWKPDLGAVDLCLTVGDQTLELSVTPVQATILMHFKARPL